MSHTSTINTVVISDIGALRAAIRELSREGIKCDILENAVPRAYYANQEGLGEAPYVIKLHEAAYDIGLYKNDVGYEARTDFYGGSVKRILGVAAEKDAAGGQHMLGRLYQRYAVCAAENHAVMNGYMSTRSKLADGTVQLELVAA